MKTINEAMKKLQESKRISLKEANETATFEAITATAIEKAKILFFTFFFISVSPSLHIVHNPETE